MHDQLILQIIGWAITAALGALIGFLAARLRRASAIDKAMLKGIRAVMRRELVIIHEDFCIKGKPISVDDKDQAAEIYGAYTDLGGNGTGRQLYEEIMRLPVSKR